MPGHDCLGLHEYKARSPVLPQPCQEDPEDAIAAAELWSLHAPLKNHELVPEGEVLEDQLRMVPGEVLQEGEKRVEEGYGGYPEGALTRWAAESREVCVATVTISTRSWADGFLEADNYMYAPKPLIRPQKKATTRKTRTISSTFDMILRFLGVQSSGRP